MTGHRCTGDVDTCPICSDRRDGVEAVPLPSDVDHASDRGVAQLEARVYGEDRQGPRTEPPAGAYMTRREAMEWERQKLRRKLREFNQQGRTA